MREVVRVMLPWETSAIDIRDPCRRKCLLYGL